MKLGFVLPVEGARASRRAILDAARAAEACGADSVWTTDRILQPGAPPGGYPYSAERGAIAFRTGRNWLEPIATMGLVAGVTERVRIGTNVLVLPYRHPVVLAQEIASLDALSDGRVLLGVGIGWMAEEFAALGISQRQRAARTDEAITLLRELWRTPDAIDFHGRFWTVENMGLPAQPSKPGGPPILVGGNSPAAIRRAVAHGDGWLGADLSPSQTEQTVTDVEEALSAGGRARNSMELSMRIRVEPTAQDDTTDGIDASALRARFDDYERTGIDTLVVDLLNVSDVAAGIELCTELYV